MIWQTLPMPIAIAIAIANSIPSMCICMSMSKSIIVSIGILTKTITATTSRSSRSSTVAVVAATTIGITTTAAITITNGRPPSSSRASIFASTSSDRLQSPEPCPPRIARPLRIEMPELVQSHPSASPYCASMQQPPLLQRHSLQHISPRRLQTEPVRHALVTVQSSAPQPGVARTKPPLWSTVSTASTSATSVCHFTSGRPWKRCAWIRAGLDGEANGNGPPPAISYSASVAFLAPPKLLRIVRYVSWSAPSSEPQQRREKHGIANKHGESCPVMGGSRKAAHGTFDYVLCPPSRPSGTDKATPGGEFSCQITIPSASAPRHRVAAAPLCVATATHAQSTPHHRTHTHTYNGGRETGSRPLAGPSPLPAALVAASRAPSHVIPIRSEIARLSPVLIHGPRSTVHGPPHHRSQHLKRSPSLTSFTPNPGSQLADQWITAPQGLPFASTEQPHRGALCRAPQLQRDLAAYATLAAGPSRSQACCLRLTTLADDVRANNGTNSR
ncbi:hypothetical protein CSOJ01_08146 [Colletotrichum sojae]|uniref:Uncharacterized protein n=1 Tax=Colletotrichum sojae TaxID=2175907 RepID=A0A8H6J711_9PEZI|nr:hypothetical protein CSOJ01_08146 [Colletotrichum sojae]